MKLLSILVTALAISAIAEAHILVEPDWAHQTGTTLQEWGFGNDINPSIPELINNSFGSSLAVVTVGTMGAGWLDSLAGFGTQTGMWDLGAEGTIVIDIDNSSEPLPYKEIWVQITYFLDISAAPTVDVPGAEFLGSETYLVEDTGMGGWYLDLTKWRIVPNPSHEQIVLTSDAMWGSVIDQVAVHTICTPEPLSLCLLALGGMVIRRCRS